MLPCLVAVVVDRLHPTPFPHSKFRQLNTLKTMAHGRVEAVERRDEAVGEEEEGVGEEVHPTVATPQTESTMLPPRRSYLAMASKQTVLHIRA